MKLVSVIIPVYKVEQYIAATVQSVLNQTYFHWELLIIDDGSPDKSREVCQQFTDSRIKIISQPNRGASAARNTGIRHAKGEYLAFLDSDDLWLPEKLAMQVEHLDDSPHVGISFTRSALIDEKGNSLDTYLMPRLQNITIPYLLRENPIGPASAAIVRREVLNQIQFQANLDDNLESCYFDETFSRANDIECWLRVAILTNWKIEGIAEPLTLYRVNSTGISANFSRHLENWEKLLDKVQSYAPEKIAPYKNMALAYELRYLARSAIRHQAPEIATEMITRALLTYWRILIEEPRRTLLTFIAAYLLKFVPYRIYSKFERLGNQLIGNKRQQYMQQDE